MPRSGWLGGRRGRRPSAPDSAMVTEPRSGAGVVGPAALLEVRANHENHPKRHAKIMHRLRTSADTRVQSPAFFFVSFVSFAVGFSLSSLLCDVRCARPCRAGFAPSPPRIAEINTMALLSRGGEGTRAERQSLCVGWSRTAFGEAGISSSIIRRPGRARSVHGRIVRLLVGGGCGRFGLNMVQYPRNSGTRTASLTRTPKALGPPPTGPSRRRPFRPDRPRLSGLVPVAVPSRGRAFAPPPPACSAAAR